MFSWFRVARDVAVKDLMLFRADWRGAMLAFLVPVALAALFGFIFRNGSRGQVERVAMGLVVEDGSAMSGGVAEALRGHRHLAVRSLSASQIEDCLLSQQVAVVLTLPEGFGGGSPAQRPRMRHAPGCLYEANWAAGIATEAILREAGRSILPQAGGAGLVDMLENRFGIVREAATPADQDGAVFGHSFCGMTLQYLLFMGMDCGLLLLRERAGGVWRRLASSPASPTAIIAGRALATMVIALMQIAFTLGCAWLVFGVPVKGSIAGLMLVALAVSCLAASCGLLVASLGGSEGRARSIAILVILAISLVGGLWLPAFLLPWWVRDLGWIMPTAWALRGLEAATWQGAGIGRAALCAAVVYAYSFVFLVVAMAFLTRRPAGRQPRGIP